MTEPHAARWDHHVPWSICPHCGALQDGAANVTGEDGPEDGDVSICFECGRWSEFDDKGGRRKLTPAKAAEVQEDPDTRWINTVYWKYREAHPERWPT